MADIVIYLALITALILSVGETLILVKTDKYWPLSVDDYLVCLGLFYSALTFENTISPYLMLISWCFAAGNLYAMLFTRMDPNGGSRERLPALGVLLVVSICGAVMTLMHLIKPEIVL